GLVYDRGTAILVAKYHNGREAELFAVPLEPAPPWVRPARPRLIGRLSGFTEPATGADLSADRTFLPVCSETVTRIYRRGEPSPWRLVAEVRYESLPIEGIAWDGQDLILAAEGKGLYRLSEPTWRAAAARRESTARSPRSNQGRMSDAQAKSKAK